MRPGLAALALLLLGAALPGPGWRPAAADELAALVAPYLRAREANAVGAVAGHAHAEPRRPGGAPEPYDAVPVLLLPPSAELEAELDAIKAHRRDSLKSYGEAARRIETALATFQSSLLYAGAGELIRGDVTDPAGRLRLTAVPAGEWLLVAWREQGQGGKAPRMRRGEAGRFPDVPVASGYWMVNYWRMRIAVRPGESTAVALTDRNVWLTVVREEVRIPEEPLKEPRKRR